MELNVPVYDATWKSFNRDQSQSNQIKTQQYDSYHDIDGGQLTYYIDDYLTQAYFSPNYQIRSSIRPRVFVDPMGSLKPEYHRKPITKTASYLSDYTFDQDQMGFREDIMSLQSRKRDQQDFSKFYGNYQLFSS